MKLKVRPWRLIWRFLLATLVIYIFGFGVFSTIFIDFSNGVHFREWGFSQTLFVIIMGAIGIVALVAALTGYYYEVESKYFTMRRMGKTYEFLYSNIEFIDIEKSRKKEQVIFYTKTAKMKYLLGDKEGVLLETLIKKCPDVMSVEEFRKRHPEEKY